MEDSILRQGVKSENKKKFRSRGEILMVNQTERTGHKPRQVDPPTEEGEDPSEPHWGENSTEISKGEGEVGHGPGNRIRVVGLRGRRGR